MKLIRAQRESETRYPTYGEARRSGALRGVILGASMALLATGGCTSSKGSSNPVRLGGDIAPVRSDRDNDGVIDSEDRCPDRKGPRSNQGCPQVEVMGRIAAPQPAKPHRPMENNNNGTEEL